MITDRQSPQHPAVKNYDISHIHCLALAAAALSPEVSAEILKTWPNIHLGQGYGKMNLPLLYRNT